jgi:hypothetical protein
MRTRMMVTGVALYALIACRQAPQQSAMDANESARAHENASGAKDAAGGAVPKAARSSLPEPSGPIDPASAEAAGQVVQSYGALIEQKNWAAANALWGDNAIQAAEFRTELSGNSEVHLEIGSPGEPEGAAGSIYVTVPVFFYGDRKDGQPFRRSADVVLRRVNNVPGSTEAQRRWHIDRIDWTG